MGGFHAGLRNVCNHVPAGFRTIVPSRFGYLGSTTPPKSNLTFKVIARTLWRFNHVFWAVERYFPAAVLGLVGVPEGLPLSTADRKTIQAELDGIFPIDQRIDGILFDTFTSNPDINNRYPFGDIRAPALICHGRDDPGPPYEGAITLASQIPEARLVAWDRGGHLALGHHPGLDEAIPALLRPTAT